MPAFARREIVASGEIGVYHCVARCVRRAFLCGVDSYTGQSFEHRKAWAERRLEFLAGVFAVDVCGFCVMSNHLHLVLRTRPDVAQGWSDEEVAHRWWQLHPQRRTEDGAPAAPTAAELAALAAERDKLAERRERLASLSWLMRCLCEPIARRANREDGCTGRFWEGRFKSQALLDEAAILACSLYVDLNPIRACLADRPEDSPHTSAYQRIRARQSPTAGGDHWLAPIAAEEPTAPCITAAQHAALVGEPMPQSGSSAPREVAPREVAPQIAQLRVAGTAYLNLPLDAYLQLLDWTGRELRADKRGSIPAELAPIIDRLSIRSETWVDCVREFGVWFRRAAGRPVSLAEFAHRQHRHWLHGISKSRLAFG